MHIGNIEKLPLTTTGSPLLIRCKTFLFVTFVIPREKECHEVYTTLQKLCQPVHMQNLYCFHYTSSNEELPKTAGWNYYSLESEFKRQKVPNEEWTLCSLNKSYELCDTCELWRMHFCIVSRTLRFTISKQRFICFQTHAKFTFQFRLQQLCWLAAHAFGQKPVYQYWLICIQTKHRYVVAVSHCLVSVHGVWKMNRCLRRFVEQTQTQITCMSLIRDQG